MEKVDIENLANRIEEEANSLFEEQKVTEGTKEEKKEVKREKPKWEEFKKSELALIFGTGINSLIAKALKMDIKEIQETEFGQALVYTIDWYLVDLLPETAQIDPNSPYVVLGTASMKLGAKVITQKVRIVKKVVNK